MVPRVASFDNYTPTPSVERRFTGLAVLARAYTPGISVSRGADNALSKFESVLTIPEKRAAFRLFIIIYGLSLSWP